MKNICIIVPFYNEGDIVDDFLVRLKSILDAQKAYAFNLVFVDDGSSDSTLEKLIGGRTKLRPYNALIVELSRNFGKEAALTAGLDAFSGDACIILDADLQDPLEVIPAFLSRWEEGYEVVAMRRSDRSSDNFFKRNAALLFYRVNNMVSDIPIPENVGDCRLMDRKVVEALARLPESRRFMKGLFAWIGFRTCFVDVVRAPRSGGRSSFSVMRLVSFAIDGFTSFSTSFLRLWTIVGLLVSTYAVLHGIYILARVALFGIELPGYASLAVIFLFFGGLQMVGLGIIGEYVGRTFQEAKRRPSYVVRRFHRGTDDA